jgi:MFS family permease
MTWPARLHGWGLLSLVFVTSGVLTLGEGSIALLVPPLLDERNASAGLIGTLLSVYGLASLASRIPGGLLYRADRSVILISGGCLLTAAAFFLIPVTQPPVLVASLLATQGFGFGLATTSVMALIMERTPEGTSSGSVMAWYAGFTGLGYAAAGFVGGRLGDVLGVGPAIRWLGLVPVAASVILAIGLVRSSPPRPATDTRLDDQDVGGASEPAVQETSSDPAAQDALPPDRSREEGRIAAFRGLHALVWVAFLVAFYLNLTWGALNAFFPIHGLAIGLTLTQIGLLIAVHSSVAAAIRFLSGSIFRWFSYERVLTAMVVLSGFAVVGIAMGRGFALLAVAWGTVGLARGLLRVASGALVMESSAPTDRARGAASSTYLAGLDLGRIVGPAIAGGIVTFTSIPVMLVAVAMLGPVAYLAFVAAVHRHAGTA